MKDIQMNLKIAKGQLSKIIESLLLIEGATFLYDEMRPEQSIEHNNKIISDIYRIAHVALGHCEGCKHENIVKQDAKLKRRLKSQLRKANIIDVNKQTKKQLNELSTIL